MSTQTITVDPLANRTDGTEGDHHITWDDDGHATFTCKSPEGSGCRRWCDTCEEECPLRSEDDVEHPWHNVDWCRVIAWFDGVGDPQDTWADSGEHPRMPHISGPIETEWTGDEYVWENADV